MERLHSLRSCHFCGVWSTCLPHKSGASRLVPCPRTRQANLLACSPQPSLNAERQAGKLWIPFLKVFWYDSTRGLNPRSTDCEANALTTTPSHQPNSMRKSSIYAFCRMQRIVWLVLKFTIKIVFCCVASKNFKHHVKI